MTSPKDHLLHALWRHNPIFMGWRHLPGGEKVRTYHLRSGPAAEWRGDHWRVADAVYPLGSEGRVARRLAAQTWPTP